MAGPCPPGGRPSHRGRRPPGAPAHARNAKRKRLKKTTRKIETAQRASSKRRDLAPDLWTDGQSHPGHKRPSLSRPTLHWATAAPCGPQRAAKRRGRAGHQPTPLLRSVLVDRACRFGAGTLDYGHPCFGGLGPGSRRSGAAFLPALTQPWLPVSCSTAAASCCDRPTGATNLLLQTKQIPLGVFLLARDYLCPKNAGPARELIPCALLAHVPCWAIYETVCK